MSAEGGAMPSMTEERALEIADDFDASALECSLALLYLASRVRSLNITLKAYRGRTPSPEVQRVLEAAKAFLDGLDPDGMYDVGHLKAMREAVEALAAREAGK